VNAIGAATIISTETMNSNGAVIMLRTTESERLHPNLDALRCRMDTMSVMTGVTKCGPTNRARANSIAMTTAAADPTSGAVQKAIVAPMNEFSKMYASV
jgi:hypothetical protein